MPLPAACNNGQEEEENLCIPVTGTTMPPSNL